jgi:hypothetical protein
MQEEPKLLDPETQNGREAGLKGQRDIEEGIKKSGARQWE